LRKNKKLTLGVGRIQINSTGTNDHYPFESVHVDCFRFARDPGTILKLCAREPSSAAFTNPCESNSRTVRQMDPKVCVPRIRHSQPQKTSVASEASKIYFDAKHVLETVQDPDSEEFVAAARIVSAFWKRARQKQD
jgi:hypothetical protein